MTVIEILTTHRLLVVKFFNANNFSASDIYSVYDQSTTNDWVPTSLGMIFLNWQLILTLYRGEEGILPVMTL